MELSVEMQRCLDVITEHGKIIKYKHGFWHIPNCELKEGYNGGVISYYFPIHQTIDYFGYGTIKALKKRNLVKTNVLDKYGNDIEVVLI